MSPEQADALVGAVVALLAALTALTWQIVVQRRQQRALHEENVARMRRIEDKVDGKGGGE